MTTADRIADLERNFRHAIAEGGDVTDIHAELDMLRDHETALLAGTVAQAINDREAPGARTRPRSTYLTAVAVRDLGADEWTVQIRAGRRRYEVTLPAPGRWALFRGNPTTGLYLSGQPAATTLEAVAAWAVATVLADAHHILSPAA